MLLPVEKVESPLSRSIRPRYVLSGQCIEVDSFDNRLDSRALCRDSSVVGKIRTNRRAADLVTSGTGVVVVQIPGFPIDSILLGLLAGFVTVLLVRLQRRREATASVGK